jgi:hypothetical protein
LRVAVVVVPGLDAELRVCDVLKGVNMTFGLLVFPPS